MRSKKKALLIVACALMLALASVMGTLAWLTDKTDTVTNTFTMGNVTIKLEETGVTNNAKAYSSLLPGSTYEKDAKVTVIGNSKACYLFIHIAESNNTLDTDKIIKWAIADGWTALDSHPGYYYRTTTKQTTDQPFNIFAGNETYSNGVVTVNTAVTNTTVSGNNLPTIAITAAAIQFDNISDVTVAWNNLPTEFTGTTN